MAEAFSSQHTNTFPDFLAQTGISLAVSTYQAGKLILLRAQDGVLNTHFVDLPKPMGIALQEPHLALGTGHQLFHYFNMPDAAPKVEPQNTHNACYLPRESHITGDIDIHEMGFANEGELWLVNTKMSCLCTTSQEYSIVPRWRPPFISGYDLSDRCHLNGLAMQDGQPRYVTALGTTDTPAGWRENKASGGILMDIQNNRMIASGLSMPHSPRWHQNKLWVLESGSGTLATVDSESGKLTTIIELPGFTRGLDFIGRYAVIGLSQVRETAVFAGLPLTKRCDERQCGVYVVDIIEKRVIAFVVFSGVVQEIFSVQVLPSSFPAILSMDDPLLRSSYAIPDEALQDISEESPEQTLLQEALLLHQQNKVDEAIAAYKAIIKKHPINKLAHFHLGKAFLDAEQWKNAEKIFNQLSRQDPHHAEAFNYLGEAQFALQEWSNAENSFDKAISIDQQYAVAHVNLARLYFQRNQFDKAWQEFEWRFKVPGFSPLDCSQPRWQGENIADKTLLIHTEQNDSLIIQFSRFLLLVTTSCKRLLVICPEPFRLLFKAIDGVDEVRVPGQLTKDEFDVYAPLLSLPELLNVTKPENTLALLPFWNTHKKIVVDTLESKKQLKVGLLWGDELSACTLEQILTITEREDIEFYNLQTELKHKERRFFEENKVINLESELISYAHSSAVISQLDLVIGIDHPLAHLSASLGKPTWVILKKSPEWNWMEHNGKSPWYPAVSLYQNIEGKIEGKDEEVFMKLKSALNNASLTID